jgi:hypothetical protein
VRERGSDSAVVMLCGGVEYGDEQRGANNADP